MEGRVACNSVGRTVAGIWIRQMGRTMAFHLSPITRAQLALLLGALFVVSCSGQASEPLRDIDYMDGQRLDVHRPQIMDASSPIVVLFHGAGLDRTNYEAFATGLAESGAVVFNADWAVLPAMKRVALEQVACAVRYARAEGAALGADPERLVLVGHSTAAVFTGEVATHGDQYIGDCPTEGSARPTALALISPAQVTGGAPWRMQSLEGPLPRTAVVHGVDDMVARPSLSERIARDLEANGYEVDLHLIEGDHYDLVKVDLGGAEDIADTPGDTTIDIILDLVSG